MSGKRSGRGCPPVPLPNVPEETDPQAAAAAPADPDAGAARRAAWSVSSALLVFSVGMSVVPPALVKIRPDLGLSTAQAGQLSACIFLPFLATVAASGRLCRLFARGWLMMAGCWAMAAGCLAAAAAGSFAALAAGSVLLGVGGALVEMTSSALLGELFEGPARTSVLNLAHVAFAAGAIGTPLCVAALIRSGMDWRMAFAAAALICAAAAVQSLRTGTHRLGHPAAVRAQPPFVPDGFCLAMSAAMGLYVAAEVGLCYWMPTYFLTVLRASDPLAAASNGVFWTGVIVGRMGAGIAGRRLGDKGILKLSCAAGIAALGVFLALGSPQAALAGAGVSGLTFAAVWPTIVSYAGDVYGPRRTLAYPWIIGAGAVGAAAGPGLIGLAAAAAGQKQAFLLAPAMYAGMAAALAAAFSLQRSAGAAYEGAEYA